MAKNMLAQLMAENKRLKEQVLYYAAKADVIQLRKMDGQPVWIQNIEEPDKSQWRLCHLDRGKYLILQGISVRGYLIEEYGESWLAYAYTPAHIDREAWEPCELCNYGRLDRVGFDDRVYLCSGNCYPPENERFGFCPKCGRPLTEEAWAELEKRLRG